MRAIPVKVHLIRRCKALNIIRASFSKGRNNNSQDSLVFDTAAISPEKGHNSLFIFSALVAHPGTSLVAQMVKNLPTVQKTHVWYLSWEDTLEMKMARTPGILAWKSRGQRAWLVTVYGVSRGWTSLVTKPSSSNLKMAISLCIFPGPCSDVAPPHTSSNASCLLIHEKRRDKGLSHISQS